MMALMDHKTTLYLPKEDVLALKAMALKSSERSLTYHVRQAIRAYLKSSQKKAQAKRYRTLMKYRSSSPKSLFGDSVDYQRQLRQEWE